MISSYINAFLEYQENFDHKPVLTFMREHDEVLVLFIVLYLTLVFYVPELIKEPFTFLYWPMTMWNFFLGTFSVLGTYFIAAGFVKLTWQNGFFWSICTDPAKSHVDGTLGFWLMLFILSKIPELLDTAFLILQRKQILLLQWVHHVATMSFCWYSYVHQTAPGWWFAAINYAVHAIMYNYFGLMAFQSLRPMLKIFAPIITALQIIQMVVGIVVLVAQRYYHQNAEALYGRPCENYHEAANKLGIGMYVAYFILFGALFKKLYLSGGAKKSQKQQQTEETVLVGRADGKVSSVNVKKNEQHASSVEEDESFCNATAEVFRELHGSDPTAHSTSPPTNKNKSE